MDKAKREILSKLTPEIYGLINECDFTNLCEIRLRAGRPVMLYYNNATCFLNEGAFVCSQKQICDLISGFCAQSVYAFENEIKNGFITIDGGHRIGISGRAVIKNEKIVNITDFSGINIRVAREYINCANNCMRYILEKDRIYNTVIISPAGVGKTTYLRDIARSLSKTKKVSIIDERGEIAAVKNGVPQFDVGFQTDVLDGFLKPDGIVHALRTLSPDVLITDEVGTHEDLKAIDDVLRGGCKIITTMHGYSMEEMLEKNKRLLRLFERAIFLERINGIPEVTKCLRL